jgi:hypothetical protein
MHRSGVAPITVTIESLFGVIHVEVRRIRTIFFELFVEALVPTIRGEKLIWMLETTPTGQRLYELDLIKPKPKGTASFRTASRASDNVLSAAIWGRSAARKRRRARGRTGGGTYLPSTVFLRRFHRAGKSIPS